MRLYSWLTDPEADVANGFPPKLFQFFATFQFSRIENTSNTVTDTIPELWPLRKSEALSGFAAHQQPTFGHLAAFVGVCISELSRNSLEKGLKFFVGAHLITNQFEKPLPPSGFGLCFGWIFLLRKVWSADR
jgi:hypothetical protein